MLLGIFLTMTFLWVMINAPTEEWRNLGISYALFASTSLLVLGLERLHPGKTHVVSFPKFKGDFGISGD